jgi:hypothetical protein
MSSCDAVQAKLLLDASADGIIVRNPSQVFLRK